MTEKKEFPSLNEDTKHIFHEFSRIYKEDIVENGTKEVYELCKQYKAQALEKGQGKDQLKSLG